MTQSVAVAGIGAVGVRARGDLRDGLLGSTALVAVMPGSVLSRRLQRLRSVSDPRTVGIIARGALFASTALVGMALASPAAAQQTIATPAQGGTISGPSASGSSVNNQTTTDPTTSGGLTLSLADAARRTQINAVTITNASGAPNADALHLSSAGSNTVSTSFNGISALTTNVSGGAAVYIASTSNSYNYFEANGSLFTGSYGFNVSTPGGQIDLNTQGFNESFIANGSAVAGVYLRAGNTATTELAASTISGFATGVDVGGSAVTVTTTGGSIAGTTYGIRTSGPATIVLSGAVSGGTNSLLLDASGNAVTLNSGATLSGTADLGGGTNTLTLAGASTTDTLNAGTLVNATKLVKSGTGTWTLSGVAAASDFTGGTTVNAGTLMLTSAAALNNSGANLPITVGQGATLYFAQTEASNNNPNTYNEFSTIAGSGNVTFAGNSLLLRTAAMYTGATLVRNGGNLELLPVDAIASSSGLTLDSQNGNVTDVSLSANQHITTLSSTGTGISAIYAEGGNYTLTLTNASGTYNGVFVNVSGGIGSLVIAGGSETLGGGASPYGTSAPLYSGGTTINSGAILTATTATAIGTGAVTNNGTLAFNGASGTVTNAISGSGGITVSNTGFGTLTFSGALAQSNNTNTGSVPLSVLDSSNVTITGSIVPTAANTNALVTLAAAGTFTNLGTMTIGNGAQGIYSSGNTTNGGIINNGSATVSTASIRGGDRAILYAGGTASLTVNNWGLIQSGQYNAIDYQNSRTLTVSNNGTGAVIYGQGTANSGFAGIADTSTALLTVSNGGKIVGKTYGINASGSTSITNSGTIASGTYSGGNVTVGAGTAIALAGGGKVFNQTGGVIQSSGNAIFNRASSLIVDNSGMIAAGTTNGGTTGIISTQSNTAITVVNRVGGSITGNDAAIYAGNAGNATGNNISITLVNQGMVSGGAGVAGIGGSGLFTINNASGATIQGGVNNGIQLNGTAGSTVNDYGTITDTVSNTAISGGDAGYAVNLFAGSTVAGAITLGGGNDTLTLYNGTGTANTAAVTIADPIAGASDTPMLRAAGTFAAATVGTVNLGGGSNTLVLRGTGTDAAGTVNSVNGAAGSLDVSTIADATHLVKSDAGIWTLTGNAGTNDFQDEGSGIGFVPAVSVSAGRLITANPVGQLNGRTVDISSGATLELDVDSLIYEDGATFTGAGVLQKTNSGNFASRSLVALAAGGLIDVQAGGFTASSDVQGRFTGNLGSLNVATDANFYTSEAAVVVDKLTGTGTVNTDISGSFTVGINNGSATFDGVIVDQNGTPGGTLTKTGTGVQTLTGVNTYTGATIISGGTLALAGSGTIASSAGLENDSMFDISGVISGTTVNALTGSGVVALGSKTLTLAAPGTIANSFTDGGIAGGTGGQIELSGGGVYQFSGINTYTGATTIDAGAKLQGTTSTLSPSSAIIDNGTLAFVQGGSGGTYAPGISGNGIVAVSGLATGNAVTFSGALTNAGGLVAGTAGNVTIGATGSVSSSSSNGAVQVTGANDIVTVLAGGSVTSTQPANGNYASAIYGTGANFAVNNAGTISAPGNDGASFGSNGIYATNGVVVSNTGNIYGIPLGSSATYRSDGVITFGDSVVNNTAAAYTAGTTYANGTLTGTTAGGGVITGGWVGTYLTGNGTVYNSGTIAGNTYQGADIQGTGAITNYAGGRIVGVGDGADIGGTGSITNDGQIAAGQYNSSTGAITVGTSGSGIRIGSGSVTNDAGGQIVGGTTNTNGNDYGVVGNGALTLTNNAATVVGGTTTVAAGKIVGGYTGVELDGGGTVNNYGLIGSGTFALGDTGTTLASGFTQGGQDGVRLVGVGATVNNYAGAAIRAGASGIYVQGSGATATAQVDTIVNTGLVTAQNGVYANSGTESTVDLRVTNTVGGVIVGTDGRGVTNTGVGPLTLTNSGIIVATNNGASAAGAATINNSGLIGAGTLSGGTTGTFTANGNTAIAMAGGTVENTSGATIGGALMSSAALTLNTAGSMNAVTVTGTGNSTISLRSGSTTGVITLGLGNDGVTLFTGTGSSFAGIANPLGGTALVSAGVHNAATVTSLALGTGTNTVTLAGAGSEAAAGSTVTGQQGSLALNTVSGLSVLTKTGTGTWVLSGAADTSTTGGISATSAAAINAGIGGAPGSGGLLQFNGTTGLTGTINVNGATIQALTAGAFGSGTITATDPTIQYSATGTYANNIVLASTAPSSDPTNIQADNGVNATLSGTIGEATAGQPLVINVAGSTGTITLAGNNTYTGLTTVAGGTLAVSAANMSGVTVASGATLTGTGLVGATTIADGGILANTQGSTLTMASLGLTSGSIINATFAAPSPNALFAVNGNLMLDGTVNVADTGAFGFGVYRLIYYRGTLTDNGLTVGTVPTDAQRVTVQTSVAGQVNIVDSSSTLQFWDGGNPALYNNGAVDGGTGTWTATSPTFTDANGLYNGAMAPQPGLAVFEAAPGTVTVDNSAGAIAVTGLQFASSGYVVTGGAIGLADPSGTTAIRVGDGTAAGAGYTATIESALTGASGLNKTDLGTLTLLGANTYTGTTTVSGGKLQGTTTSIVGSNIVDNATLAYNQAASGTVTQAISGSGVVTVAGLVGSNALTFAGIDTQTGGFVVTDASNTIFTGTATGAANEVTLQGAGATLTNAANATISGVNAGVIAAAGSTINNAGTIAATASSNFSTNAAVILAASPTSIINNTGSISGANDGVVVNGGGRINNAGTISGGGTGNGVIALASANALVIANSGSITGPATAGAGYWGVAFENASSTLVNTGLVQGDEGLEVTTGNTSVVNGATGTIVGTTYGVQTAGNSALALNSYGTITGNNSILGTGANALSLQAGSNTGAITTGSGADTLSLYTGSVTTAAVVDPTTGLTVQSAGTHGAATFGAINLGTGANVLALRGAGDGTAANGAGGSLALNTVTNVPTITKQDTGTWTLTGAATPSVAAAAINAGVGGTPASGGLLVFSGTGLTGPITVNGATIRATSGAAFGTGTINEVAAVTQFAATATYANNIVLQSTTVPTLFQTVGAGIAATLSGTITQGAGAAAQPLVFGSIDANGNANTGTFVLTNAGNAWTGVTTVNAGTTLRGTTATLSGGSFTDNGVLNFAQVAAGTSARAIAGTGTVLINGGGPVTLTGAITAAGGVQIGANTTAILSNVSGNGNTTVSLSGDNAVLNVAAGGTITANNGGAVFGTAQNGTVNNAGTIGSTGNLSAIYFNPNLGTATVTNTGAVSATNGSAVYAGAGTALTLNNTGALNSTNRPAVLTNGAASINNGAAGTINGYFGVYANGTLALNNAGQITAAGAGGNAVTASSGGTIVNTGTLSATTAGGWGVEMDAAGSVDNQGIINADSGLVATTDTGVSLTNEGTITAMSNGVWGYGSSVNLTNSGTITGGGSTGTAGVRAEAAGSSIANSGTVQASSTAGVGIYMTGGTLTNRSGGTISGGTVAGGGYGTAIQLVGTGNMLALQAGSTVNGRIDASGTTDASNGYTFSGTLNGGFTGGSGNDTVTLVTPVTVTGTLDGGAGMDTLVLDGTGAGMLGSAQVVNFENGVKQGSGTWTLTGTTAASPTAFAINAGTLAVAGGNALADNGSVTIASGATLQLNASETIGSLAGAGNVTLGANTLTTGGLNASPTFAGVASGTGGLTKIGTGTLTLSGANTYTGATTVNAGTLALGASNVIADASAVGVATGATLDLGANSDTVASLALAGTLAGTGTLTASSYTLNGGTVNANLGAGTLTQAGGASTLNGTAGAATVNVNGGTLSLGASDRLADTAALNVASGATLNLGAFTDTVGTAALAGTLAGTGTLTAATYTLNGATVAANLGAGTLTQAGGASMLNGTAAAATVNVNAGTLALGASNRLSDTATVMIANGAILDLGANSDTVGLVGIAGTLAGTGTLTAAEYDLSGASVNANLGAGNMFQVAGISTLNGTAGATNVLVNAGTLVLGASNRLADDAAVGVATGATLNMGANSDTVGTLALNGTLAGTGTLTAATYTLNGAAVNANLGTGSLVQAGGTSVLSGTAATNMVAVMAGTLRLGASDRIADTAVIGVASGTTFDLAGYNETVGTLAGAGTLALGAGTLTAGGTNADFAFGGNVTGTGDLTKVGSGTFSLIGNEAMTGRLNVNAGTLMLAGTTAGSVRIQGGTLTGASMIAGNLLLSSGTLSPGIATQPVAMIQAGSLTVTGGTSVFDFGGTASGFTADMLKITGAAALSGGTVTTRALDTSANYKMEQTYTLLTSGGLTGAYANGTTFTQVSNNADLYYRLRYDLVANGVVLEVRKPIDFTTTLGAGATGNQLAVAGALNGGVLTGSDAFVTALNAISQLTPDQRRSTLDNIGGESIADISTSVALVGNRFNALLRQRVAVGAAGNSADPSLIAGIAGGKRGLDQVRAGGQVGAEGSSFADGSANNHAGAWVQTFGGAGRLDGSNGTASIRDQSYGVAAGIDAKVAGLSIGGAFAASALDTRVDGRSATNRGTLYQGGGYVAYDNGQAYASAVGSYFSGDVTSSRQVYIGAALQGTATGTPRVTGYTAGGAAGYRLPIGGGVRFTPQVSFQATHVDRDAFTETGAGVLSLSAAKDVRNLYTATAEGRLSYLSAAPGGIIEPYAGAGVAFNFGDLDTLAANRFTGAPTGTGAFSVNGARLSPTTALINGGIEAHPNDRVTLGMGVETRLSNRQRDGRLELHVKLGF